MSETEKLIIAKNELSKKHFEESMKKMTEAMQKLQIIRNQLTVITNRVNELKKATEIPNENENEKNE